MHTCSEKFSQSERICSSAIINHPFYLKNITSLNILKLEEEKKIESLINNLF